MGNTTSVAQSTADSLTKHLINEGEKSSQPVTSHHEHVSISSILLITFHPERIILNL